MKYTLLLWPHANARYQRESLTLARAELELMLARLLPGAVVSEGAGGALPGLAIEAPRPLSAAQIDAVRAHSLLYGLFEARGDGSLLPVAGRAEARLGDDLPAILKYKGKTNELFMQLLVNVALYASDFWNAGGPLELVDPMCGRATAPFIALNRGWNAVGADVDRADLGEAERFFKRYLEYHRLKHSLSRESRTVAGGAPVPVVRFETADTPERFRAGHTVTLRLARLDAARLADALGRRAFHLAVCDLPYGIQHLPRPESGFHPASGPRPESGSRPASSSHAGGNRLEDLASRSLEALREALRPGGAAALSFNAQTLSRDRVRELMEGAGLEPLRGGPYDRFGHWVEQAITRDVAVCRRPK